ncbi:MAG: FAD-dependent oxidoreductase [Proteobacteria bacterium]|nr:FAD-dependent oxidoreductase [Pseudomonadota bacterium]
MEGIIFSSWDHKIIDNRGLPQEQWKKVEKLKLPGQFAGKEIAAFMGWNGVIVKSDRVDVVDMTREYLEQVQGFSCGRCVPCRIGTRVLLEIMQKIISGKAKEEDISQMENLGKAIIEGSKCEIGKSSPVPVLHAVANYRNDFLSVIQGKRTVKKGTYESHLTAPCMDVCPVHLDVPTYVELIKERRFEESLALIRQRNALPGVCGRVCIRPCEFACRRNLLDDPVQIRFLKRFVADYEIAHQLEPPVISEEKKQEKVAVVGAGPAGLSCALYLAQKSYPVTIFEALPEPGGMAAVGIPDYRLPREILRREVEIARKAGVEIIYNTRIGVDKTMDDLWKEGYKAIFIGVGSHDSKAMGVEGEEKGYEGFIPGVQFLRDINLGKEIYRGDKLMVVGGGNVAIDCARSAFRVGFKEVNLVYRRSRKEMPADAVEIEDAEKEGVKFHFLTLPTKIIAEGNKVKAVECIRMELGEPDSSGRRRPIPVKGSEFILETDVLIPAIGQDQDLSFIHEGDGVVITKWGTVKVDEDSLASDRAGIFSGGDCVTGPAALVNALSAGYDAAITIDHYLNREPLDLPDFRKKGKFINKFEDYSQEVKVPAVGGLPKSTMEHLPADTRIHTFEEVESGFDAQSAIQDASRCLRCYRVALIALSED